MTDCLHHPGPDSPVPRPRLALALLILVLVAGCLWPATQGEFLWCDDYTVVDNPDLADTAGLARIWRGGSTEQYQPLTYTLLWVLDKAFGRGPEVFKLAAVSLHALCAALWFVLLCGLMRRSTALLAALLFGLHPLCVESVAWVYELKNPWSLVWLLLSALAFTRHRPGQKLMLATAWLAFALALLAKSSVVVFPILLWFLLMWGPGESPPRRQRLATVCWPLGPFFALSLVAGIATLWYEQSVTGASGEAWQRTPLQRLAVAGQVFWFYAEKIVLPHNLGFAYPPFGLSGWLAWLAPLLTLLAATTLFLQRHRSETHRLGWLAVALYGAALFPVSGVFNIFMHRYTFVADHLAYLALLVLTPFICLAVLHSGEWLGSRKLGQWCLALGIGISAVLSFQRSQLFQDHEQLWVDSEEQVGATWWGQVQLGLMRKQEGDLEASTRHYRKALALNDNVEARINLANILTEQQRFLEALPHFRRAAEMTPVGPQVLHSYSSALVANGLLDQALEQVQQLAQADATDRLAVSNLQRLTTLVTQSDREQQRLLEILEQRPDDAAAWRRLAEVSLGIGRFSIARQALSRWHELEPEHAEALQSLTWLATLGPNPDFHDAAMARQHADKLLLLSPGEDPRTLEVVAAAHAANGEFSRASGLVRRALHLAERAPGGEAMAPRLLVQLDRYDRQADSVQPTDE